MRQMIVKQLYIYVYIYIYIYICERGPLDIFISNFVIFYDTFARLRMNPEKSCCKMMSFTSFVHKSGRKLQGIPQNVNQVFQIELTKPEICN